MSNETAVNVISPLNEIDFQSDGIVSKQLLKKENGNLTLFAFYKGETLTEHTSKYDAFAFILEGEINFTIGGKSFIVRKGELVNLPANVPHGLSANENSKMLLIMIK